MATREGSSKKQLNRVGSLSIITNLLNRSKSSSSDYIPIFQPEISDIMRGYGDCEHPLPESVVLVEKIVIQQMRSLLKDVINVAIDRKGSPRPTQKDFEYLMRRHPTKIYRLQKHIKDLEFRRRYQDMINGRPTSFSYDLDDEKSDDEPEEIAEQYDEEKMRRLFRADRISLTLNGAQYTQFNEARRTSFHCRNSNVIRTKLRTLMSPPPDAYLSAHVFTVLGFLVHETIATIVDYAILTRMDTSNRAAEPYHRVTSSGASFNMLHACPEVTQGRGLDGMKPITVQEIHEAIRRHAMTYDRPLGMHRNVVDRPYTVPYLAL